MSTPKQTPTFRRRLERLRELAASLPAYEGELGDHIEPISSQRLLERRPSADEPRIDALNMGTVFGQRTDGCGTVGCLAGMTILEYPEAAMETRSRVAREYNLPPAGVDALDVAGRVLGLDPCTRDALFCGGGSAWVDDLCRAPREAVLTALDRVIAGRDGPDIWDGTEPR